MNIFSIADINLMVISLCYQNKGKDSHGYWDFLSESVFIVPAMLPAKNYCQKMITEWDRGTCQ